MPWTSVCNCSEEKKLQVVEDSNKDCRNCNGKDYPECLQVCVNFNMWEEKE